MGEHQDVDGEPEDKEEETELSLREENLADEIAKKFYDPLDHIEPKQQKFVMMQVTTNMSPAEIGRALGLTAYMRKKWQDDQHVQAYQKECMKKFGGQEIIETARRQVVFIREKMFNEVADRFRDPETAAEEYFEDRDPDNPPSVQERMAFLERFAKFTTFDQLMKTWEKVEKSFRLDAGQATERVDDNAMEHQARVRFSKYKKQTSQRQSLDEGARAAVAKGLSFEEFQKQNAVDAEFERVDTPESPEEATEDGEVHEAELVEEEEEWEEVSIEEWEIKRS